MPPCKGYEFPRKNRKNKIQLTTQKKIASLRIPTYNIKLSIILLFNRYTQPKKPLPHNRSASHLG